MNILSSSPIRHASFAFAAILLVALAPLGPEARADAPIRKAKVGEHKVKIKTFGGKAKIKDKPSGKQKVKIKGPNGAFAADVAYSAIAPPCGGPFYDQPFYDEPFYDEPFYGW